MSTDYFAHVAFGVFIEGEKAEAFEELMSDKMDELQEEEEELAGWDLVNRARELVLKENPSLLSDLRAENYAPTDTHLIFTGFEDERPGRCSTESELWLLGYGLLGFPLDRVLPEEFRKKADWHTWVEA